MIEAAAISNPLAEARSAASGSGAPVRRSSGLLERALEALEQADRAQKEAERQTEAVALGRGDTVTAMVALAKADVSLRFVLALRNRAVEAYQEIMRLQV